MNRINLENGKYSLVHDNGFGFHALRHGQPWRKLEGDGLLLAAAYEIEELRAKLLKINELLFAVGAPLGSAQYFQIREICAEELRKL